MYNYLSFLKWLKMVKNLIDIDLYYSISSKHIRIYYWHGRTKKSLAFIDKENGNIIKNVYASKPKVYGNIEDNIKSIKNTITFLYK